MSLIKKTTVCIAIFLVLYCTMGLSSRPIEAVPPITITAPSAILVEANTGTVVFEQNANDKRQVASVTKLMTFLLVFEDLDNGRISLDDTMTISRNAASQIGSQALLDAGATYRLEDILRSSVIASANDGAVALAEYLAGTEEAFVTRMNERAMQLNMDNTHYMNCTGLTAEGQYTTARDVAIVSCEMAKHSAYFTYASLWMDTLRHPSGRTTDLTNTNRLVRFYTGCDGFKTGSTNEAKYCISATVQKNGMRLIAVVLGSPQSQTRFDEARNILEYGFANYKRVKIASAGDFVEQTLKVTMGARDQVNVAVGTGLSMLLRNGQEKLLSLEVELPESIAAPVQKGQTIGSVSVLLNHQVIARLPAVAAETIGLPGFLEDLLSLLKNWR